MDDKAVIVINFPVKAHVYKYLQAKVGEKLVVTNTNFFGATVLDILSKQYSDYSSVSDEITFPVEISFRYMRTHGIYIDKRIVRKFNNRFDDMFREEMRSHVSISLQQNNIPKDKSLRQFLFSYNIDEDDIKFETLKKDLGRNLKN
jgi:hypothetical protein